MSASRELTGPPLDPAIARRAGGTLAELADAAIARHPERAALIADRPDRAGETWTYAELGRNADLVARRLAAAGLRVGDRLLVWAPNGPWVVAVYLAAWRIGAAIVPLDVRMTSQVASRIAGSAGARLALYDPSIAGGDSGVRPALALDASLPEGAAALPPAPRGDTPDAVAEILFTSGTTSEPKGVILTHRAMVHAAAATTQLVGLGSERGLALIPLSHIYGQIGPLLSGWLSSSTLVFPSAIAPSALTAAMARHRPTALTVVPAFADLLAERIRSEVRRTGAARKFERGRRIGRRLPFALRRRLFRAVLRPLGGSLRLVTSGGARLDPTTASFFEDLGVVVMEGYGATEMSPISGFSRRHRPHGTAGRPAAGASIRIAPDGELLAHGPNMAAGYWARPDLDAEVFAGGWAHTGDAAQIDDDGNLVILGRTRERITLASGLKVYPEDVEAAFHDEGAVRAVCALELDGAIVVAAVPAAGADDADLEAARRAASLRLAPHQRPGRIVRYPDDDLPRTHTLKVRREAVAERLGVLAPERGRKQVRPATATGDSGGWGDTVPDRLALLVERILFDRGIAVEVTPDSRPAELGLDSLGAVELALRAEEELGIVIDEAGLAGGAPIRDLGLEETSPASPWAVARWPFAGPVIAVRELLQRVLLGPLVGAWTGGPRVAGAEHAAALREPVIVCANHSSHFDIPLLQRALPGRMRRRLAVAAAADYFFDDRLRRFLVLAGAAAFPFDRNERPRESIERVEDRLRRGWNVALFPEGTRSRTGNMGPFRPGIGVIATQLGAIVLPAYLQGAHDVLPPGGRWPRRGRVTVRFGAALRPEPGEDPWVFTARLEAAIGAMAPGSR
ncbi:MAG: AMP-binding protein [Candidatus Limnocylindrales bacterium]